MSMKSKVGALLGAGLLTFAVAGIAFGGDKTSITICHGTGSNTNPYITESPAINSSGTDAGLLAEGHSSHIGPLWFDGITVAWGDIIPPYTYQIPGGILFSYAGLNWTDAGQAIYYNGCLPPGESPPPTAAPTAAPTNPPTAAPTATPQITGAPESTTPPTAAPTINGAGAITQPPTDTQLGSAGTSGPSDGAWLLVVALGVLLASIVVLAPARAKNRR
jgi:hypothetical protein